MIPLHYSKHWSSKVKLFEMKTITFMVILTIAETCLAESNFTFDLKLDRVPKMVAFRIGTLFDKYLCHNFFA